MAMSHRTIALIMLAGSAFCFAAWFNTRDAMLYNQSSSVPAGLYLRSQEAALRGAFVTVRAGDVAPGYAALRDFTDPGDRFIKRVAATAGDEVCASDRQVTINGGLAIERQTHDAVGRALPSWSGCATLTGEQILLLGDTADSFDGRYWGPISRRLIEGVWRPLAREH